LVKLEVAHLHSTLHVWLQLIQLMLGLQLILPWQLIIWLWLQLSTVRVVVTDSAEAVVVTNLAEATDNLAAVVATDSAACQQKSL
jgi:hypothetical protein